MKNNYIFPCMIAILCLAAMTGCSDKNNTEAKTKSIASQITTTSTTDTITVETTTTTTIITAAATETTIEITTTAPENETKMLDRIADSLDEPSELTSPFGDISDAYVCFGGTALYPSVRVLSADEVQKLSKVLNSMEWEEFPDKPKTPPTLGPNDLTLYVNDNGKRGELDLLCDMYRDENGIRHFMIKSPETADESFTIYQICEDLLFNSDLKDVSTHLFMMQDIIQPDGTYDMNDYWDLIWDDVIKFIQDENHNGGQINGKIDI
ncbi:MAG: hypothetical protein BWZ04_02378 [Firmicutes bacterium ADurb.BinA205]|nr:MAG: hypothetical protein BWZ04_02378 [Firmicutes bacterium ADurb.BinA205]